MKRIFGYIVICAFAALFLMAPMSLYFWFEIPRTPIVPNPGNGFIYPYNNHGVTHYVTGFDHLLDSVFQKALFIVVPVIIISVILAKATASGERGNK